MRPQPRTPAGEPRHECLYRALRPLAAELTAGPGHSVNRGLTTINLNQRECFMSHERPVEAECPQCGAARSVTIWDSLNADINPEAREELFQGKINAFECASCHVTVLLPVPLLYHDMGRRFVVQYFPAEALDDDAFLDRFTTDGTDRSTAEMFDKAPEALRAMRRLDYMQRPHIVFDMGELVRYVVFRERVFDRAREADQD